MVKRLYTMALSLITLSLSVLAADPAIPIKIESTKPANGAVLSSLSEITFKFNFSDVYEYYTDVPQENFGLATTGKTCTLYKGTDTSGEVITTVTVPTRVPKGDSFIAGSTELTIPLSVDVILEAGADYVFIIPAKAFYCGVAGKGYTNTAITTATEMYFKGAESSAEDQLLLVSTTPALNSTLDRLSTFEMEFNQEVALAESNANVYLYEGDDLLETRPLSISSNLNSVVAVFP